MPGPAILLFDGECAFCRKGVSILRRMDWLNRIAYRDARDTANLPPCSEPLEPQKLLDEMHVVTPDGQRAFAGYRAIRWLSWRVPPLWLVAPLLYLPGALWLGTWVYRWIAKNRFKLVPCEHGQCRITPPRGRE
jgi:predicted DCC family thiol-disulfide oxidoreductase YuxK